MAVTKTISRDDVRTSILEASIALMNEGGLGALSMREVARRAGVSHQAPYHYFTDREAILAELAGDGFDRLYDYMVSAIGLARPKMGDKNRAMGEAYIRFALNNPEVFRLMFRVEMCRSLALSRSQGKSRQVLPARRHHARRQRRSQRHRQDQPGPRAGHRLMVDGARPRHADAGGQARRSLRRHDRPARSRRRPHHRFLLRTPDEVAPDTMRRK